MSKIITITFSPSIDKSATIPELISDKKMRCSTVNCEPGGGGINVARVLQRLGGKVIAIFPSGGFTGMFFNRLLENENVPFISTQTKNETKENFVIFDKSSDKEYRFGMPSNEIFDNEWQEIIKVIENQKNVSFIIASGSLPPGIPNDIYAQLSKIAISKNAKLIVDTSGKSLQNAINENIYLIKPNLEELGILVNKKNIKIENVDVEARKLIKNKNCEIIVVSLGANGAMLVTKNETISIKPPSVLVKSTVGAGDSMLAGIVFGLSKKMSYKECMQYGIACGTATTMNVGSSLCVRNDIEKLLKIVKNQV